jgi:hypothetical protein
MDKEKIDYFFAEFDCLISSGADPSKALLKAAEAYASGADPSKALLKAAEAYAYVFYEIHNKPKVSKIKKLLNLIKEKICTK